MLICMKRTATGLNILVLLVICCVLPLLASCESAEEKRKKEIREQVFPKWDIELDPHKAQNSPIGTKHQ